MDADMSFILQLILAGLMGIHCGIIKVTHVSVKAGGSISIPCLYDQDYRNNVKYLCKGRYWCFCASVVQTNQPKSSSARFSISDDTQGIFTVTINGIRDATTSYWCAVKIGNVLDPDAKQHFWLSGTTGMSNLYVEQQEITAFEGGSVTVLCHYIYPEKTRWCRLGGTCVTDHSGSIDGTTVTINASVSNVFNVTMRELRTESSGWYLCAHGDLQMPVHVTVNELPSTTMSPSTARTLSTTHQHSSLLTSVEPCTARPTISTIPGTSGESLHDEHKRSTKVTILITILFLLLVVVAALFGWRITRRNKTTPMSSDVPAGSQTGSDPDMLYATIVHNQHVAAQKEQDQTPKESVTYSAIVLRDGAKQRIEPEDGGAIYSTVGPH